MEESALLRVRRAEAPVAARSHGDRSSVGRRDPARTSPVPFVQRCGDGAAACAGGGACAGHGDDKTLLRSAAGENEAWPLAGSLIHQALSAPGRPLDSSTLTD